MTKVVVSFAGMILGAGSIHEMDVLRHGAMGWLLNAAPTPSTLGTSLRTFTLGHVRKIDPVAARFLVKLTGQALLLADADQVAFLDIDDTIKAIYGYQGRATATGNQGARASMRSSQSSRPPIRTVDRGFTPPQARRVPRRVPPNRSPTPGRL